MLDEKRDVISGDGVPFILKDWSRLAGIPVEGKYSFDRFGVTPKGAEDV